MLRDRDPAILRRLRVLGRALADLFERQLLVVLFRRPQRGARVAAVEIGVAFRLHAVVLELEVQRRGHRCLGQVRHVVAHVDHVVVALEREGLGQAHAALLRVQHDLHLVVAVQRARARADRERGVVVRQDAGRAGAGQARLREVDARTVGLEQHLVLVRVDLVAVLQQFQAADHAAGRVDVDFIDVGGDGDDLGLHGRGCRGRARDGAGRGRGRCRRQVIRLGRVRGLRDLGRRLRREHRLLAVGHHPVVPQDDQRDGEHDPQDGTFIDFHWSYSGMLATASGW